jgi:hypothetical protein
MGRDGLSILPVRVATIDNYQGEETDVVVASLVRSNSAGKVGFLREPERINVLMSRARCGMILIGNSHTLRSASSLAARKHWGVVLSQLEARGCIVPGLPGVCQIHQRSLLPLLDGLTAFNERAPDGGCLQPCNALLPCGHLCPLSCHAYDREHKLIQCREMVMTRCDQGHLITKRCGARDPPCPTCVEIRRVRRAALESLEKLVRRYDTPVCWVKGLSHSVLRRRVRTAVSSTHRDHTACLHSSQAKHSCTCAKSSICQSPYRQMLRRSLAPHKTAGYSYEQAPRK